MIIKQISCKTCLTKSSLTDYVINPYVGCAHACAYCYAVFVKKFQNITAPWGKFVYARINSPEVLRLELKKKPPGSIWLSSVTDPYLPLEADLQLTRRILETMQRSPYRIKFSLSVLTKSALVERDFALLKELNAELGCSVNSLDERALSIIEPCASAPAQRIETLRHAKSCGIPVFAFISPVLPGLTALDELVSALSFCDYAAVELLNTKPYIMQRLAPLLREHFPDTLAQIQWCTRNPRLYFAQIQAQVRRLEKEHGLSIRHLIRH